MEHGTYVFLLQGEVGLVAVMTPLAGLSAFFCEIFCKLDTTQISQKQPCPIPAGACGLAQSSGGF